MSWEPSNEKQFNDLNKRFDQLLAVVVKQNEVLKTIQQQILDCLDFAYLNGRQVIDVLNLIQRVSPQLSEPDRESITELIAGISAKDKELNSAIMAMKLQCIPILPPLPKQEGGAA